MQIQLASQKLKAGLGSYYTKIVLLKKTRHCVFDVCIQTVGSIHKQKKQQQHSGGFSSAISDLW